MISHINSRSVLMPLFLFTAALILLMAHTAEADEDDGTFLGVSTLLDSGDPVSKLDIVFLGDGFTSDEQELFNDKVDQAVLFFLDTHPFLALRCAFNIHRVNIASRESGTDIPETCGIDPETGNPKPSPRPAQSRATAMNTTYCAGSVFRCVGTTDFSLVFNNATRAPGNDFVVVLINDNGDGGCRFGTTTFVTLSDRFDKVVVHELGHAIANLADEYDADDPGTTTFPDPEPMQANITIETNRRRLKWGDLVLFSTPIPTTTCEAPGYSGASDIVGTFEGANARFKCGIYRPQYTCRMKRSQEPFCAVCRRKIIIDVKSYLCDPLAISLTELLIKNDHDGWSRGKGDIYFNFNVVSGSEIISGRWPGSSGDVGIGTGESRSLNNFFVALVPEPRAGEMGSISVQVRDNDWPDDDDTIRDDAGTTFTGAGSINIDQRDYRLQGNIRRSDLTILFDFLHIKDDMDGIAGAGDIFVNYTISNGDVEIHGRWPSSGDKAIDSGGTAEMALLAAAVPQPGSGNQLSIEVVVWDDDSFLTFGDDKIGENTFTFNAGSNFGANNHVHVRDENNYRLTLSIVD